MLKQVYTMQRAFKQEHDFYALNGVTADSTDIYAFAPIQVEIMLPARYQYVMTSNRTSFSCVATAQLDSDPAVDTWRIDQTGTLTVQIDDVAEE